MALIYLEQDFKKQVLSAYFAWGSIEFNICRWARKGREGMMGTNMLLKVPVKQQTEDGNKGN